MNQVTILNHPLAQHHLTRLRATDTPPEMFRAQLRRLTMLLLYEATRDLATQSTPVQTPLAVTEGRSIAPRVALVPILRAGLGMVDAALEMLPAAEVWHLGFYRDEKSLRPVEYYKKIPQGNPVDVALVLDPMLATGGSSEAALAAMRLWGVPQVKLLAMIAAPEGVRHVTAAYPDTQIFICALDEKLNERAYILPGLGDAGDRTFNACA